VAVVQGGITSASREAIRPVPQAFNTLYFYNTQYEGACATAIVSAPPPRRPRTWASSSVHAEKFGKKVYTIAADYNYGQITAKWVKKFTQEHGGEVLQTDYFPLAVSDFGAAITDPGGQAGLRHVGAGRRQPHLVLSGNGRRRA